MSERESPPPAEGLRVGMDPTDLWWERHITATYLRWRERYPHLFPTSGTDGAGVSSRTAAPQRDTAAVAPPIPGRNGTAIPHPAIRRAQVPAAGGPRQSTTARAASLITLAKEETP